MMRSKLRLRETLGLICLFLTIVALSITITINFRPLYLFDIQHLNILKDVEVDRVTLIKNYDHLMMYLNNPFEKTLVFPDFPMSDSAAFHFYEVKKLFLLCYGVLLVTLMPSVLYLKYLVKNQRLWTLIRPFQLGMFLPVLFGFFMLIGFDQFFTLFHQVLFAGDTTWLFDPRVDSIILALPEDYFMHAFLIFFVLYEGICASFYLLSRRTK